jgi:hypothetical protein
LLSTSCPPDIRGRRECRAPAAPAVSCAVWVDGTRGSHHGHTGSPGIPCAMVLTVSFVLSPVIGLSCHRHLRDTSRKLDAGVEASGPHDFAVRVSTVVIGAATSTASHPASVTIAIRPSFGVEQRGGYCCF